MKFIFDYFSRFVYVQISPDRLMVRNVMTGETISEVPEMAIGGEPKAALAFGSQARLAAARPGVTLVNPFAHPRTLVSDFTVAELLLRYFVRRVVGHRLLTPSPVIVMHPLGDPEGGFTQIEFRAIRELGLGAGASQVVLWRGDNLTDEQIRSKKFDGNGEVIN